MNYVNQTILRAALVTSIIILAGCNISQENNTTLTFSSAPENPFTIEIVDTPQTRNQGLMSRTELPETSGMLFLFPESDTRQFWMKNTLIPLDIIYAQDNTITQIIEFVPPCKSDPCDAYPSSDAVNQAIELNAGTAKKLNLQSGDTFSLE